MRRRLLDGTAYALIDPISRFLLMAGEEGEGGEGGAGSGDGAAAGQNGAAGAGEGEGAGEGAAAKEGAQAGAAGEGEGTDWRTLVTDEKLREHATRFTSLDDLVKANLESRQKLSKAVTPPAKDAKPEEVAAWHKVLGVPDKPEAYEFPDLPEGHEVTDEVKASREVWAKRFHELAIPSAAAKELARMVNEDQAAFEAAQIEADKKFADTQSEALKREWGAEFDKNKTFADRAATELFGADLDTVRQIETKDGRFVLDHAPLMKALAKIGREMQEGTLGAVLTDNERESAETELRDLRRQISEAQGKGESKRANELYQKEQALIAKLKGNAPVVGAQGRAA